MSFVAWESAFVGPASVAVHDDGDVLGDEFFGDGWWCCSGGVWWGFDGHWGLSGWGGFLGLLYRVGLWCFGFEVGEGFEGGFEVVLGGVEDEVEDFLGGVGGGFVDGVPVAGGEGVEVGGFLGVEWG